MENKLTILVGIPSSGKSTHAEILGEFFGYTVVSSDAIREEISFYEDQSKNEEVFKIFHKRIDEALAEGKDVVADATNINIKSRRPIIDIGKKYDALINAIVFVTPIGTCYLSDSTREHSVGNKVINKMVNKFECPFYEEGFDSITFRSSSKFILAEPWNKKHDKLMKGFEQYNPHHKYTLDVHCRKVYEEFMKRFNEHSIDVASEEDISFMMEGIKYHDVGKVLTRTIDEEGVGHFYHHENVGAYVYLSEKYHSSTWTGEYSAVQSAFIINYHMRPFGWTTDKAKERAERLFKPDKFNILKIFNEIDNKC